MRLTSTYRRSQRARLRSLLALVCVLGGPSLALAPAAIAGTAPASATLQQCATATIPQTERAASFAGEMTAIPGTARMEIRVELEERTAGELLYRTVAATGLGVWHSSAAGVKIFTHIQQVTNLSAPAFYRGVLRFRWLSARGRLLKAAVLRTASCEQPAPPAEAPGATGASPSGSTGTGSTGAGSTGTTTTGAAS
jgi:hypothetical protein